MQHIHKGQLLYQGHHLHLKRDKNTHQQIEVKRLVPAAAAHGSGNGIAHHWHDGHVAQQHQYRDVYGIAQRAEVLSTFQNSREIAQVE
ncbi:hypothetical protein SDC9_179397 [bioreactor metagenome]|uniref:Uncharacterized protein n=1 Tax=bioreactor metagenome TaxID=1076179 RepID=A0A645H0T8_9ZZZZ